MGLGIGKRSSTRRALASKYQQKYHAKYQKRQFLQTLALKAVESLYQAESPTLSAISSCKSYDIFTTVSTGPRCGPPGKELVHFHGGRMKGQWKAGKKVLGGMRGAGI